MSIAACGAADLRPFDPETEIHFALSQDVEFHLRELFAALHTIGDLAQGQPGDRLADVTPDRLGPLLRTFSRFGDTLMMESVLMGPNQITGRKLRSAA